MTETQLALLRVVAGLTFTMYDAGGGIVAEGLGRDGVVIDDPDPVTLVFKFPVVLFRLDRMARTYALFAPDDPEPVAVGAASPDNWEGWQLDAPTTLTVAISYVTVDADPVD